MTAKKSPVDRMRSIPCNWLAWRKPAEAPLALRHHLLMILPRYKIFVLLRFGPESGWPPFEALGEKSIFL